MIQQPLMVPVPYFCDRTNILLPIVNLDGNTALDQLNVSFDYFLKNIVIGNIGFPFIVEQPATSTLQHDHQQVGALRDSRNQRFSGFSEYVFTDADIFRPGNIFKILPYSLLPSERQPAMLIAVPLSKGDRIYFPSTVQWATLYSANCEKSIPTWSNQGRSPENSSHFSLRHYPA